MAAAREAAGLGRYCRAARLGNGRWASRRAPPLTDRGHARRAGVGYLPRDQAGQGLTCAAPAYDPACIPATSFTASSFTACAIATASASFPLTNRDRASSHFWLSGETCAVVESY